MLYGYAAVYKHTGYKWLHLAFNDKYCLGTLLCVQRVFYQSALSDNFKLLYWWVSGFICGFLGFFPEKLYLLY